MDRGFAVRTHASHQVWRHVKVRRQTRDIA
jgi:hypothetical protein